MRRSWSRIAVLVLPALLVLGHALGIGKIDLFERLDQIYYDARLRATLPGTRDERIVIVDIDERSLAEVGRWPWGRQLLAKLTHELLVRQQARLVAFDIGFPEPDNSSGYGQLQRLAKGPFADQPRFAAQVEELRGTLDYDAIFAEAMAGKPVVLGYYFSSDRGGYRSGKLPPPVVAGEALGAHAGRFVRFDGYGANLPLFTDAAAASGHMNPYTDIDGLIRRVPVVAELDGALYASLSLAGFRLLTGQPRVAFDWAPARPGAAAAPATLRLMQGDTAIPVPVSANGTVLIPYRGLPGPQGGSYAYVGAAQVLAGALAPGTLAGKIVLVGSTAPGLQDLRATPISQAYPGVEIHANLLSGLLDGTIAYEPAWATGYEVAMLVALTALLAFALPRLSAAQQIGFSLLLLALLFALNWWLYQAHRLVLPSASGMVLVALLFLAYVSHAYFIESRAKRQLTRLFGTYVPPELVDEMARDPERYSLAAQNREMTVMFCDIRDFTRLAEAMDPEALRMLVNEVFSAVTSVVQQQRGTLDKYMGDAVMAFWGAPVETARHAELAVGTALALPGALEPLNAANKSRGRPQIALGVGINTGTMCVGDMGSNVRRAYTVVGDAVNLASRLESLTRVYGVDAICGEETRLAAPQFVWRELDRVRVKGKAQAATIYEPLGPAAERERWRDELLLWDAALQAYRAGDWAEAERAVGTLRARWPQRPLYRLYAERIARLRAQPPGPRWDGSTGFDDK
jgi:adenylate cyclase